MKAALFALVVLVCAVGVFSAVASGDYSDPKNPGKCTINENLILEPGEHKHPERCENIICGKDGSAEFQSCPLKGVPCKDLGPVDETKPYPQCCLTKFECEGKIVEL